jgi:hypothetical protein
MALVKRKNGKKYFFQYNNTANGRKKIYIGAEGSLEAFTAYESENQQKLQKEEQKETRNILKKLLNDFDQYHHILELLLRSNLLQNGYYKRKSEFRNIRSVNYDN